MSRIDSKVLPPRPAMRAGGRFAAYLEMTRQNESIIAKAAAKAMADVLTKPSAAEDLVVACSRTDVVDGDLPPPLADDSFPLSLHITHGDVASVTRWMQLRVPRLAACMTESRIPSAAVVDARRASFDWQNEIVRSLLLCIRISTSSELREDEEDAFQKVGCGDGGQSSLESGNRRAASRYDRFNCFDAMVQALCGDTDRIAPPVEADDRLALAARILCMKQRTTAEDGHAGAQRCSPLAFALRRGAARFALRLVSTQLPILSSASGVLFSVLATGAPPSTLSEESVSVEVREACFRSLNLSKSVSFNDWLDFCFVTPFSTRSLTGPFILHCTASNAVDALRGILTDDAAATMVMRRCGRRCDALLAGWRGTVVAATAVHRSAEAAIEWRHVGSCELLVSALPRCCCQCHHGGPGEDAVTPSIGPRTPCGVSYDVSCLLGVAVAAAANDPPQDKRPDALRILHIVASAAATSRCNVANALCGWLSSGLELAVLRIVLQSRGARRGNGQRVASRWDCLLVDADDDDRCTTLAAMSLRMKRPSAVVEEGPGPVVPTSENAPRPLIAAAAMLLHGITESVLLGTLA